MSRRLGASEVLPRPVEILSGELGSTCIARGESGARGPSPSVEGQEEVAPDTGYK